LNRHGVKVAVFNEAMQGFRRATWFTWSASGRPARAGLRLFFAAAAKSKAEFPMSKQRRQIATPYSLNGASSVLQYAQCTIRSYLERKDYEWFHTAQTVWYY
jgi:hypothetical protein